MFRGDVPKASFYEWGAMQSRVRFTGGYSAAYDNGYLDQAYRPAKPLNGGVLDDSGLRVLRNLGCTHLILHYSLFREESKGRRVKRRFKRNPALRLLVDDRVNGIASFAIEYPPEPRPGAD